MENGVKEKRQKGRKRREALLMMMCVIMTFWKGIDVMIIWLRFAFGCLREWDALSDRMIDAISAVVVAIPSALLAVFIVLATIWVVEYAKGE